MPLSNTFHVIAIWRCFCRRLFWGEIIPIPVCAICNSSNHVYMNQDLSSKIVGGKRIVQNYIGMTTALLELCLSPQHCSPTTTRHSEQVMSCQPSEPRLSHLPAKLWDSSLHRTCFFFPIPESSGSELYPAIHTGLSDVRFASSGSATDPTGYLSAKMGVPAIMCNNLRENGTPVAETIHP